VAEFLKVAENVGIDKGDIPDLTRAPSSLLEALEAHLATLEGKKPTTSSSSNISLAQHNGAMAANAEQIDESLKRQALAEEEAAMNQYKKSTNPFLSSPTSAGPAGGQPILDLFGGDMQDGASSNSGLSHSSNQKASDDLLQLAANPFATPTAAAPAIPPMPNHNWSGSTAQNGFSGHFATDNSFVSAFGNSANGSTNGFDAFGDLLQPSGNMAMTGAAPKPANSSSNKVLTGDLDSSLASLAMNLTINKTQPPKNPQWSGTAKTGAAPAQQPAGQWNAQPMMGAPMGAGMQGQMAFRPMVPMVPMNPGGFPAAGQPANPMAAGIRPMMGTGGPSPFGMAQPMAAGTMSMSGMMSDSNQQLDPFGAL
jgi:hypothetical protein